MMTSQTLVTPQGKIIQVADEMGNNSIANQQGTTIMKYDSLPLDGRTEYRFFEGSNQRNFPLSNTEADGNKLPVGSAMVVQRAYLSVVTTTGTAPALTVVNVEPISLGSFPGIAAAEFNLEIANQIVIKNVPVLSWLPEFNKDAENALNTSFEFDTMVSIQPLLEYVVRMKIGSLTPVADTHIRMTIEGVGSIIAVRNTQ